MYVEFPRALVAVSHVIKYKGSGVENVSMEGNQSSVIGSSDGILKADGKCCFGEYKKVTKIRCQCL